VVGVEIEGVSPSILRWLTKQGKKVIRGLVKGFYAGISRRLFPEVFY